jgi:hypothetical protein
MIVCHISGKKFERDVTTEFQVFRFVNDAHTASPEFPDDAIVRNCLADH